MTRHRRKPIEHFPNFDEMIPIDPDEFHTTLNFTINAAKRKAIVENPANYSFKMVDSIGQVSEYAFTDNPFTRTLMAIQERYDNMEKCTSALIRIRALYGIIKNPRLIPWITVNKEITAIHPAVIDAAATVTLSKEGEFPIETFLAKVEELTTTKYKEKI